MNSAGYEELGINVQALLTVEVGLCRTQSGEAIECVLGIPGREGAVRRLWRARSGRMDDDQVRDLSAWIERAVQMALYRETGVQGTLVM